MQCQGSAFAKVIRLDPAKLKVPTLDGVKLVVQTLGGVWGQAKAELKYEKFEKAIFGTVQKSDEAIQSYIARHDVQYEDLLGMQATLDEMRAYILLRNSTLPMDDKKRIIVDAAGDLKYDKVISSLRLLGSKFFNEVQSGPNKTGNRLKTYDINYVEDPEQESEEPSEMAFVSAEWNDDYILENLMSEGDEDALIIQQFEDTLCETLQSDPDVATCLATYLEARKRLGDKAKSRGFWGPSKSSPKGKGKGKNKGGFRNQFRRPLSQRILDSTCRRCFQKGHWKAECPLNAKGGSSQPSAPTSSAFAGMTIAEEEEPSMIDEDILTELPSDAFVFVAEEVPSHAFKPWLSRRVTPHHSTCSSDVGKLQSAIAKRRPELVNRLRAICRLETVSEAEPLNRNAPRTDPQCQKSGLTSKQVEAALFVSHGTSGIVDLGASMSVIGQKQFQDLCQALPNAIISQMKEVPCEVNFRFGNDSTVTGRRAILFPVGKRWIKVVVVPSNTPFLLANSVFRSLGAVIDTEDNTVYFKKLGKTVSIVLTDRKLYRLDLVDLLHTPESDPSSKHAAAVNECFNTVTEAKQLSPCNVTGLTKQQTPSSAEAKCDVSDAPDTAVRLEDSSRETPVSSVPACRDGKLQQSVRPIGRQTSSPIHSGDRDPGCGGHSSNDSGRTAGLCDGFRQSPSGQVLSQHGEGGPIHDLVCRDVPPQHQAHTCSIPPFHSPSCGTTRTDACTDQSQVQSQGQECTSHDTTSTGMAQLGRGGDARGPGGHVGPHPHRGEPPRDDTHAEPDGRHGEHPPADSEPSESVETQSRSMNSGHRHVIADLCETWQQCHLHEHESIYDPMVMEETNVYTVKNGNWVAKEMWDYLSSRGYLDDPRILQRNLTDVLEVYCSHNSQLTKQADAMDLSAIRFGRSNGDLSTVLGRYRLYETLAKKLPRNIWLSPKCKPWCKWNVFNMTRDPDLATRIIAERDEDRVHLLLCDAIFQFQLWRSPQSHAHLEQPLGSQMLDQPEFDSIRARTLKARCDMCMAGRLRHPESGKLLKKGTIILTTSQIMAHRIDQLRCDHSHEHDDVAGSCRHPQLGRINVSQFSELYTSSFAQKLSRCFRCISMTREKSRADSEDVMVTTPDGPVEPNPKRIKIDGKQTPPLIYRRIRMQEQYQQILPELLEAAPRVGKRVFSDNQHELFVKLQSQFPDYQVVAFELCKGADRYRTPGGIVTQSQAPWRYTLGIHRNQDGIFFDDQWEDWTALKRKQLIRKCYPARLIVTIFATKTLENQNNNPLSDQQSQSLKPNSSSPHPDEPFAKRARNNQHNSLEPTTSTNQFEPPVTDNRPQMNASHHGPKFSKLTSEQRQQLLRMHHNLGHPDAQLLGNVLRDQGWSNQAIEGIRDMHCPSCFEHQKPKIARPGHLGEPREFNELVAIDAVQWTSKHGKVFTFYHMVDSGSNFQIAFPCHERPTSTELAQLIQRHWLSWAGPPQFLMSDSAGEFCSEEFGRFLASFDVRSIVIAAEAHWQMGKCERHGAILQDMLDKYEDNHPIITFEDLETGLYHCTGAKNSLSRHRGYSPEMWVLGKSRHASSQNSAEQIGPSDYLCDPEVTDQGDEQFIKNLEKRETARTAFIRADHDMKIRRALLRRQRPERNRPHIGQWVMFWRQGRGNAPGSWSGPAKVIMTEDRNIIWITHLSRLYRCAPEHVRSLSERESAEIPVNQPDESPHIPPSDLGTGVFQYHDLSEQRAPPASTNPPDNILPEIDAPHNAPNPITSHNDSTNSNEVNPVQPDSEPGVPSGTPSVVNGDMSGPSESTMPSGIDVPVPEAAEGELSDSSLYVHDTWTIQGNQVIRHHRNARSRLFCPTNVATCPIPVEDLLPDRTTTVYTANGSSWSMSDQWKNNIQAHQTLPNIWTGETTFFIAPDKIPSTNPHHTILTTETDAIIGCELILNLECEDVQSCLGKTALEQIAFLASAAKRQRAEVKERTLSPKELEQFHSAKVKEVNSWLSTETVRRIARSQIPESQILRSRWVLTWKPIDNSDAKTNETSNPQQYKPKARLVILGYEDPELEALQRDSPTLGKDTRTLILQYAASAKWQIRSFDVQTAFLRGSRQDGRILGMEPPVEMRNHMKLQPWECCELLKSAYGLVNAPLLWYEELKGSLLSLGFLISPLDPCLFVLPKPDGTGIHGLVGIHVDDGLGAGDSQFAKAISRLEEKFPFGSKKEGSFIFTGIQLSQQWDGSIELDQTQYVQDIPSIDIPRHRRVDLESLVTTEERQSLRGLVGSIQYAATNTRPDLSAKLSLLQARINQAQVKDLVDANKLLSEAKLYKDTKITIKSIPLDDLRFVSFSDASFATRANAQSQKGCLILASSKQIGEWQSSDISPLIWYSRKIARVVGSTLASETYALSGSVDLLSWLRIHWNWIRNPSDAWKSPTKCLENSPEAYAVVDCKSLYDLIQKTTVPQCQEYRTTIEALIIKERLREGIVVKWVHSAAQMADALTKHMDCTNLRNFLKHGKCIIHDVDEILKARADKRTQKTWIEHHAQDVPPSDFQHQS